MKTETEKRIEDSANAMKDEIFNVIGKHAPREMSAEVNAEFMSAAASALAHAMICHAAPLAEEGETMGAKAAAMLSDHYEWNKEPLEQWWASVKNKEFAAAVRAEFSGRKNTIHPKGEELPAAAKKAIENFQMTVGGIEDWEGASEEERVFYVLRTNLKTLFNMQATMGSLDEKSMVNVSLNALGMAYLELWARYHKDDTSLEAVATDLLRQLIECNADELAESRLDAQGVAGSA